jgi:hypothetical protein
MKTVMVYARSERNGRSVTGELTDCVGAAYSLPPGERVVEGYIGALTWLREFAIRHDLGELYDIRFRLDEISDAPTQVHPV